MKIEVGDIVELHNGEVHKVDRMLGNDPDHVNALGYGPFVIDGLRYHKDGRFSNSGFASLRSVKRIISRASDDTQSSQESEPKPWRDMTEEAQSSYYSLAGWVAVNATPRGIDLWNEFVENLGINPEPVRETVTLYGADRASKGRSWSFIGRGDDATHRITFDLIDGEPDCEKCPTCGTAKNVNMEKL